MEPTASVVGLLKEAIIKTVETTSANLVIISGNPAASVVEAHYLIPEILSLKMNRLVIILTIILLALTFKTEAQVVGNFVEDETDLYASTKQVNQFFRRFNGEETVTGDRLYPEDKGYRDPDLRRKYFGNLFNNDNSFLKENVRNEFVSHVLDKKSPVYLDFHGGDWFAEVTTTFTYMGRDQMLTLFLILEKDTIGSKWVINNVYFEPFAKIFADQDSLRRTGQKFLHPMSHELDFMNLVRTFEDKSSLEHYLQWKYRPDYLTLFVYEFKRGNLKFKTINKVKFHFFQINGWYFEIADFNRKGNNTGWLISALVRVNQEEKELMRKYICHE